MSGRQTIVLAAILPLLALLLSPTPAGAQPPNDDGRRRPGGSARGPGFGQRGPGLAGLAGSLNLLRRQDVRKELELLDDQIRELESYGRQVQVRMQERFRQQMQELRDAEPEQRMQSIRETAKKLNTEIKEHVAQVLLPHQVQRLEQIERQQRMQGAGLAAWVGVAAELDISEQQRQQLRTKAVAIEQEMRRKFAELRRQAQDELLSVLTPEQQTEFRALMGKPFEFAPPEAPQPRFRPRNEPQP